VKIKRISSSDKNLPLPKRMTEHSAGFDLHAGVTAPIKLDPFDRLRLRRFAWSSILLNDPKPHLLNIVRRRSTNV